MAACGSSSESAPLIDGNYQSFATHGQTWSNVTILLMYVLEAAHTAAPLSCTSWYALCRLHSVSHVHNDAYRL